MSKSRRTTSILLALMLLAVFQTSLAQPGKYHLGRKATDAEIAGWDIDVRPDGKGLPPGEGSVDDGEQVYDSHCAVCHGTFGESNEYLPLTGIRDRLNEATTLFDYINRAMPFPQSKSLTADQVYAATAYVLNLNNIVDFDFVANKDTLPEVKMPARDKMKAFAGLMRVDGQPDVHNTACMENCATDVKVTASLPKGFTKDMYGDISDNFRGLSTMNERAPVETQTASEPGPGNENPAPKLIQNYGCVACHAVDHKIIGPAFQDVAAHYAGQSGAISHLTDKIRHGGAGVWGQIPMPPQTGPTNKELADIIHWVLAQQPAKQAD